MTWARIHLGALFREKPRSIDPAKYSDELFELFSVPAYERRIPDLARGGEIGSTKVLVEPGDTLLCRIVPHIRRGWVVPSSAGHRQIASGEWIILRHDDFDPGYLRHLVLSDAFHQQFMRTVAGVGGSLMRARPAQAARISIQRPPLSEQGRIAAILDQANELRIKRSRALTLLDELATQLFLDMFGDVVANDRDWPVGRVSEIVAGFSSGKSLATIEDDGSKDVNRVLKVSAVTSGTFKPSESKPLPRTYLPPASHFVSEGDLLISRANTSELIGATAYVGQAPTSLVLSDKIWRFEWPLNARSEPIFVWQMFSRPEFRRLISDRATGSSGSMKNVSQSTVLSLPVIMPPARAQAEFSSSFERIERVRALHRAHLVNLDEFFDSLQYRAFNGEL